VLFQCLYAVFSVDGINQKYFQELCAKYEAVCQQCLGEVENLKVMFSICMISIVFIMPPPLR